MGGLGSTITQTSRFEELTQGVTIRPTNKVFPKAGGSNSETLKQQMEEVVQEAKNAGYERYVFETSHRGRSGQIYPDTLVYFDVSVKNGEASVGKNTKLGQALDKARQDYEDVIVLQTRPTYTATTAHSRGLLHTSYSDRREATYMIMVKNKKG